jgi:hypothetical protein
MDRLIAFVVLIASISCTAPLPRACLDEQSDRNDWKGLEVAPVDAEEIREISGAAEYIARIGNRREYWGQSTDGRVMICLKDPWSNDPCYATSFIVMKVEGHWKSDPENEIESICVD